MTTDKYDIAIIGGGIVGLATGLRLIEGNPGTRLCIVEKEAEVATHQTGNNSGVIHSGLYYKPGSAKAKTCITGSKLMVEFCKQHKIAHDICGKVVVATNEAELPALAELLRRGLANSVQGITEIGPERLREIEPHAAGIKALWVPSTGIVDFPAVARKYAELITAAGGELKLGTRVSGLSRTSDGEQIITASRGDIRAKLIINCGGLHCDRIARMGGAQSRARIVPFRGEYYKLVPSSEHLVKGLIYPVPDPRFPFLGVHFTRMIAGGVECGPNAVLAFKREGYTRLSFSLRDSFDILTSLGFWKMARKYWRTGFGEMYRSFSKAAFVRALQKLLPEIQAKDLQDGGAGVRAQAMQPDGAMVDDFLIIREEGAIHVLNAPSPAATASLAIGAQIAELVSMKKEKMGAESSAV